MGIQNDLEEDTKEISVGHNNLGFLTDSNSSLSSNYSPSKIITNPNAEKPEEYVSSVNHIVSNQPKPRDSQLWRDLVGFWFLGFCNNYGYVVMLSAAHDIIGKFDKNTHNIESDENNDRNCHIMSTGAILLADILPALLIKLVAPFLPFWVNVRVAAAILLTTAGFLLVGFAEYQWMALLGVVCTSLSSGLGETTFLAYSSRFNRNVISTWASGTGGAGVGGSLSYATLRAAGVNSLNTMLIMLVVPGLEIIIFWILIRKPIKQTSLLVSSSDLDQSDEIKQENSQSITQVNEHERPLKTIKEKLFYIVYLLRYMLPLAIVYLTEYFINQGLYELIYFKNISMEKGTQYRWFNVVYQIGVLISRSTVNLISIDKIWIFPILQTLNVVYFLNEAIFYITPNIWIVFVVVLFEGLFGGGAYVNTFFKMSKEVPHARKQFAMGFVATSDAIGISLAGFLAMPVHNAICAIPAPNRL